MELVPTRTATLIAIDLGSWQLVLAWIICQEYRPEVAAVRVRGAGRGRSEFTRWAGGGEGSRRAQFATGATTEKGAYCARAL